MKVKSVFLICVVAIIGGFVFAGCSDDNATEPEPAEEPVLKDLSFGNRGFNYGYWGKTDESDALEVKAIGGNVVRLVFRWYRETTSNDSYNPNGSVADGYIESSYLSRLDEEIQWLSNNGISIILTVEAGGGSTKEQNFWNDSVMLQRFKDMWKFLIVRYRDNDAIGGWEILSEPHPNKYFGSNFPDTKVRDFYTDVILSMTSIANKGRDFIVGPQFYYKPSHLSKDLLITDSAIKDRIVYAFNLLAGADKSSDYYSYSYLKGEVKMATDFRDAYNVRIFCDQVGAELSLSNSANIRKNMISLLEENDIPWTYWNWRGGVFAVRNIDGSYNSAVFDFFNSVL